MAAVTAAMTVPANLVYVQGALSPVSADGLNSFVQLVDKVATLRTFTGTTNMTVQLLGTASPNDGGEGQFYYNPTSMAADDNGATTVQPSGQIIGRWIRLGSGPQPTLPNLMMVANNAATLRAFTGQTGQAVQLLGYTTPNDGGAGQFFWNPTSTATDDGGITTIAPSSTSPGRWIRLGSTSAFRNKLMQNTTFYVSTSGNNGNNGQTPATAWQTLNGAWLNLAELYDGGGFTASVQMLDGTFTQGLSTSPQTTGFAGIAFVGNAGTPTNTIVSTNGTSAISINQPGTNVICQNFQVQAVGGGHGILVAEGVGGVDNMVFGTISGGGSHMFTTNNGVINASAQSFRIIGGANAFIVAGGSSTIAMDNCVFTLVGTPAFTTAFAYAQFGYLSISAGTFVGSATGSRYGATMNGVIYTNGAGATYLPGNSGGTTSSGGQYI